MKKTILVLVLILTAFSICYGLTVGKRTGFDYGIIVGGSTGFPTGGGEVTATYWNTAMTDRWTDAMTVDSLWTTTMNTEIP